MEINAFLMMGALSIIEAGEEPSGPVCTRYAQLAEEMGWVRIGGAGSWQLTLRGHQQLGVMLRADYLLDPVSRGLSLKKTGEALQRMIELVQADDMWAKRAVFFAEAVITALLSAEELGEVTLNPRSILYYLSSQGEGFQYHLPMSPQARVLIDQHDSFMPSNAKDKEEIYCHMGALLAAVYAPMIGHDGDP